jgi:arylformamidase
MLHDISPTISPDLKVWPGDTPPSREVLLDIGRGDNITLSTLRTTVHAGSHADGPNHYGRGESIDRRPLEHYIGPCRLIDAEVPRATRVQRSHLAGGLDGPVPPRILIRTGTYPDPNSFNKDFAALSPELIDELHGLGVTTVGIDAPSVDLFDSKDLPAHKAFLRNDMSILEGLVLQGVPAGDYELIAPPLKLAGFDGSPVRAVLRTLDQGP